MENPICNITVLDNPNRKYASTVNLVFFRAYPLYKNFQIYVNGLKNWNEYKKYYPNCQIQIFVDQSIAEDEGIMNIIKQLNARVFLVKCSDYVEAEKYHIGIFPMFWRLFPAFDIFKHPTKIIHSNELEPQEEDVKWFKYMNSVENLKYPNIGFIHRTGRIFDKPDITDIKFEGIIPYPKVIGGRQMIFKQAPFSVLTDFFDRVNSGEKIKQIYEASKIKSEHGKFPFGIDEVFLNTDYLEWMVDNGYAVGIMTKYMPSYPVYFLRHRIMKDSKSKELMDYILQKKQSLKESLSEFDKLYYKYPHHEEFAKECATRFYEVVDKYPNWLGREYSLLIQKAFYGYVDRVCVIMVRNNKIEDVIDLH